MKKAKRQAKKPTKKPKQVMKNNGELNKYIDMDALNKAWNALSKEEQAEYGTPEELHQTCLEMIEQLKKQMPTHSNAGNSPRTCSASPVSSIYAQHMEEPIVMSELPGIYKESTYSINYFAKYGRPAIKGKKEFVDVNDIYFHINLAREIPDLSDGDHSEFIKNLN